jgi:sigma-E factor negative regulatory protein RseC
MLETRAIVIQIHGAEATVESKNSGGCSNCNADGGCGSSKLSKMFCREPRQFRVKNEAQAQVGDEVEVVLADGVLLRGALTVYLLPVALMIGGGMFCAHWATSPASRDGYALIGAISGLLLGALVAKLLTQRHRGLAVAHSVIHPQ